MSEGDSHWFCDDAGTWSGPYRQERGDGWLSGYFDDGQPHGTWRGGGGGAVGEALAFEGHYADGAREGDWTFYTDGDAVAEGSYRDGFAHGDWRFSGDKSIDAHYVWGTLHGPWRAAGPADGASERGFYFHGKKHGVWTQEAEVSGQVKEIKRTVWSMGEILDDDADDPLAGEDGARAAMDAYLEADAKGGRLSTDNLVSYPVLTDFADKDRFEEGEDAYEKAIILSNYEIDEIRMDGTTAKVVVTLHQTCEVVAGDTAKAKKADISVEYTLKQQDGFWRIDTPITEPHPFPGAYMEAIGGRSSELGKSIMETCLTKGTIKDGKAASGKASKGGGKINKGKGGNKINKGKGGKRGR
jgi:hypothetical protein